jgi:hypothetical protein
MHEQMFSVAKLEIRVPQESLHLAEAEDIL